MAFLFMSYAPIAIVKNVKKVNATKIDIFSRKKALNDSEKVSFLTEFKKSIEDPNLLNTPCVHSKTKKIIEIYQKLLDKYMPLKKLSRKQKSFYLKPWLTPEIQKSIKKKDELHRKSLRLKLPPLSVNTKCIFTNLKN